MGCYKIYPDNIVLPDDGCFLHIFHISYLLLATQGHSLVWVLEQSFLSTITHKKWGLVGKLDQCNSKCIYLQKQEKLRIK